MSVLMCVYNTPIEYLKEAVQSILDQTYESIEFVIVDDASSEKDVVDYLNELAHEVSNVILVRNSSNIGLTKSLNLGLNSCHGKYIARMDSDDISLPNRLQRQMEHLKQNLHVALVGSNIITFGNGIEEKDGSFNISRCDDPEVYRIRSLFQHSGPPHPTFMFKAGFLQKNSIKYREDILKAQDYGIIVDILKSSGDIYKIKEPLLKYRIHKGQITAQSEIEQAAYQWRVSYDYISIVFPELTEVERVAVASFGYIYDNKQVIETINRNDELKRLCIPICKYESQLRNSRCYIRAVKSIIRINRRVRRYDGRKFETELRRELWKKAVRFYNNNGGLGIVEPYILLSYRFCTD